LIETGTPVSWSTLSYPKENTIYDGVVGDINNVYFPATLRKPWLDEPPLYSLVSGGVAHLFGADREQVPPSSYTRIPSVLVSLITMVAVFWVGWVFFGFTVGFVATVFYGLTPIFVMGSRLSVPENVIAAAVVLTLVPLKNYLRRPYLIFAVILGSIAAILGLMKPTGFFFAPLVVFFMIRKKRWADSLVVLGITTLGVIAFLYYGYSYDWNIFKVILSEQGQRFAGWSGMAHILYSPAYDIFITRDGWYIFSLFSAFLMVLKRKKQEEDLILSIFFVYWLLIAVFSGTEGDLLPWYRSPMFPLLAIFGSRGLIKMFKDADFFSAVFTVGLLMTGRVLLLNAFRPTTPTIVFRVVFFLAMLPGLGMLVWKNNWLRWLVRGLMLVCVIMGAWYNVKYIYNAFELRCESIVCPIGPSTKLSEVRFPFFWRYLVLPDSTNMLTTKRPVF